MAESFKGQLHFSQDKSTLSSTSGAAMGIKLAEVDFSLSHQVHATSLQSTNQQAQLSANNNSIISYSTAKTSSTLTQMTLALQPSQWIPAFPFPTPMTLSQRAKFAHECALMNIKSQKKLTAVPHILSQNMVPDLASSTVKLPPSNNFYTDNGNESKDQEDVLSLPSTVNDQINLNANLGDKNPITTSLKQFLKEYQDDEKRNISSIPNEILNLPYFDIKQKKTRKWESLFEEVKHSKEVLDRSEWAQRCNDSFLINVPMFEGEDLRIIALAALTMGNCSLTSCTKIYRLSLDDPETERQKHINPLRSPPILIKFDSPVNRCRFVKEFNQHKFTVADFKNVLKNSGAQDDRIYAEENLTSKNKEILQKVENLKRLKTIQDFKIIDGRIVVYMNEVDQGTIIFDVDDLHDILEKRMNSLQQLRLLYKQQINALTDQSFNQYFEKWFRIKNDIIEDILDY